ncbi:MAG: hypothetical protein LUQ66_08265 [Methanoregula sp.]|nr:hypothetical protein [Methanoregula sp.]
MKTIVFLLLLGVILITPAMAVTNGHWDIMTVEKDFLNGHTDGLYTSIVIDKNNIPHVSWVNEARNQVEYGTYKDDIWTIERVGPIDSRSTGRVYYTFTTSIALDPQGNPAISYAGIDGHLYFAHRDTNGTWTIKDVDGTPYYKDQWSSLKYNPVNGKPYIAFTGKRYVSDVPYGSHLSLASMNDNGDWKIDILEASDDVTYDVGYEPSLAFNSNGKATVVYRTGYNTWGHKLEYTRIARQHVDNTWVILGSPVQCDDSYKCGFHSSLALDSEGNAHFTGVSANPTRKWTGLELFGLNTSEVTAKSSSVYIPGFGDSDYSADVWNSLVLDSTDSPQISYYDPGTRHLMCYGVNYAEYNNITAVDEHGDVGKCNALSLDSRGNPWISYHDATNNALKVARWVPDTERSVSESWKITTVAKGGGGQTSIALDSSKNPRISYYNASGQSLDYAERDSKGTWKTQTVADFHQGKFSVLALTSVGNACIGYYDETNHAVNYAQQTGPGTWNIETVEKGVTLGDDGGPITLVLDPVGNAHLAYYDTEGQRMSYAQQTGTGTWDIEKVDASRIGQHPSLALHTADNVPAISYLSEDGGTPKLKYVDKTSGLWVTNNYDLQATAGPTSLDLNANTIQGERAEIAYTGSADGNSGKQSLGYIEIDPSSQFSWKQTVDNWDETTQNVWIKSLSLRHGLPGHAAIAYYYEKSSSEKGLKYATARWGNWKTENITDNAGGYLSMVLDKKSTPYISYYDESDDSVKLAVLEKS